MATRRFLLTALLGLLGTAVALVLAEVLDAPWLRLAAVAFLVGALIAREAWTWWGRGRLWLATTAVLLALVVLALLAQRLT